MTIERILTHPEAASAEAIQTAIDAFDGYGRLVLPAMDLLLDRGIELRSGIELVGQGSATVLRKGPGRIYPMSGYHNYGMQDVPLTSTTGLAVGMTVSVLDNLRLGFYETFARITWIDGDWVGIDTGLSADYTADQQPRLTTAYPMIFGHRISNAAVRNLVLDGRREDQEIPMGGCRGGAIYLARSSATEVSGIRQYDYHGEGISFQMCRDVVVRESEFSRNSGNGIHPGAGSTNCLIDDCRSTGNEHSGFFFCVRANHITVRNGVFEENGDGISIGTRDCHNLIEACRIHVNHGPGVLLRPDRSPVEVHSCRFQHCSIQGNAEREGGGQIVIAGPARDLEFSENDIQGDAHNPKPGILMEAATQKVHLRDNRFAGCDPDIRADERSLAHTTTSFECGHGEFIENRFRHLGYGVSP